MTDNTDMLNKIIGHITCTDVVDQPDGSAICVFSYDKQFKEKYKQAFNLKRFSKRHFEKTLDEAIRRTYEIYKNTSPKAEANDE